MNSTRGLTQGRGARGRKTMRFLCGLAPLREIFLRRGVRRSSNPWGKGSRKRA